jgi:transketolase
MLNKEANLHKDVFTTKLDQIPTRDGYGDGATEAAEKDSNVVVLTGDLTESTRSQTFKERFPEKFIEVGVAEQNMAGIAAGMALSGKTPFIASYATFNPGRNWDQVRVSICYSKANVKIIGAHAGLSVGPDGATHQALEDIAITRVLPNLIVLSPCDYIEAKKATITAAKHKGPVYIRLARDKTPVFTTDKTKFEIGKATTLMEGGDITIIGTGPILYEALLAAKELKDNRNITCEVINVSSIKPLDEETIIKAAKKTGRVVTVEEHQKAGGLGSAVAELLAQKAPVPMKLLGIDDNFGESGKYSELLEKFGLSAHHIEIEVRNFLQETR